MKATRLAVTVFLAGLCGFAWYSTVNSFFDIKHQKAKVEATAKDFYSRGLYQLAYQNYREAISLEPDATLYKGELDSAKAFYEENPEDGAAMLETAYEELRGAFPEQPFVWEESVQFYIDRGKTTEAGKLLRRAELSGVTSEKLSAQMEKLYYLYTNVGFSYADMDRQAQNGYYRAFDRGEWSLVAAAGEEVFSLDVDYMGPVGENGMVVTKTHDGEAILYTPDKVRRARFRVDFDEALGVGNAMIPLKLPNGTWSFFDARGNEVKGGFEAVSMFQSGAAFVKQPGQPWTLMNTEGKLANISFEDVRISENGSFLNKDVLLVKQGGAWRITDMTGTPVSDFSCEDIDINAGQPIAFLKNGKWGFVKADGTVFMEPRFERARSYSGGVAAVCENGLWGFIDPYGRQVVPCTLKDVGYFNSAGSCTLESDAERPFRLIKWVVER